jgi:predicted AlkP superfamily phosphohydrolase/phosphomutase/tetratricopeptide (TPR) repeat protein
MNRIARKVLLIGWDAADWKIINPLIDAGHMPAMENLVNEGVMGNMTTLEPPFSPMLWTSIATGKYADKHGVLGFTEPDPEGMGMRPVTSQSRKTKAIWNILMQNGYKTHVLGWWPSNPVEPLNGIMLSNHFAHAKSRLRQPWPVMPGSVHPPLLKEFFAELRIHPQELSDQHLLPFVPDAAKIDQTKDPRLRIIAKNLAEAATLHSAATWILDTQPWDFLAIYLDTIDHFCHGFMKYHPPRLHNIPEEDFNLYRHVVTSAYRFHDMMLESLINLAGEDTTIIIVSDHGFHSDHLRTTYIPDEPAGPAEHHREHGIIAIKGPGIRKDELIYGASLLNVTPTILTLFGLPVGRDMDGIPILQAFSDEIQIETIPSWDNVKGNDGMHPAETLKDPVAERQALQQLIDLGYVEDPGPDKQKAAEKAEKESKYNLARVFISNYRYQEAIQMLEDLYDKEKDQGRFALRLAKCYCETGNYSKAESLLDGFIKTAFEAGHDAKEIKEEYDKKIEESPKEKKKLEREMHQKMRHQATLQSNISQAHLMLFDIRILNEKPADILKDLEEKFPEEAKPVAIQRKLAGLYYKLRQFDKAENCYKLLLAYNPENAASYNGLALVYMAQRKYVEAANSALDAIGLNYYHPMAHYHLGEALYALEDYSNAVNAYEVCLKIIPTFGSVRNKLIDIYSGKLNNPERAAKHKAYFDKKNVREGDQEEGDAAPEFGEMQSIIIELKDPVIVVSGLPRSGTSLMMQMLEMGGIPVYADNTRTADENNPKGYYEHEAVKKLGKDKKWLADTTGKAVKIVSHFLPHLPAKYNYKVIFMLRDLSEVVRSQHKMLVRSGKHKEDLYPGRLEIIFKNQLLRANAWFKANHNASVLYINHSDAIHNPLDTARKVQQFLGMKMDTEKMAVAIDPSLYREKKTNNDA